MRLRYAIGGVLALIAGALLAVYLLLRSSLPQLDGSLRTPGLGAAVRIERDSLGVPTVIAATRADLAFATGFLHAQDRFFQMDLSRRVAAGELAELFGKPAIEHDKSLRRFRFRHVAQAVLARASTEQRAMLEAYARGVNVGIASLRSRPWEYWVLGLTPVPWRAEDTILVIDAMWWDLQGGGFKREILRREVNARLGGPNCDAGWKCGLGFFYPARTVWDAPNDGVGAAAPSDAADVPPPETLDVRSAEARMRPAITQAFGMIDDELDRHAQIGSNGWAVAGRLSATGAAIVASDMHLTQRVPPTWYHMRLRLTGSASEPVLDLNGVTLPGAPVLVAGSNGQIAWGFTNSYGNWLNVSQVPCVALDDQQLHTATGDLPLAVSLESINVRHDQSMLMRVQSTPEGLLLEADPDRHSCWIGSWLAQLPEATNFNLIGLERASSVTQALALAPDIGIPHQNFVVGDREGHIAWSIFGRIPADTRPNRSLAPTAWTSTADQPRLVDPASGRIWTANARVITDAGQESLIGGDEATLGAEYDLGARAHQIRDDLLSLQRPATTADMLRIQLDDRAVFLSRWHDLLLQLIDGEAGAAHAERAQFAQLVAQWNGHASTDSISYRLVRAFHEQVQQAVWDMLMDALDVPNAARGPIPDQFEHALWQLVTTQPMHMLDASYRNWREFMLRQLDGTISALQKSCGDLRHCTWGSHNAIAIRHPLSAAIPFVAWLVDMPIVELPGDRDMPKVQEGISGASERFAVSPGNEAQGYFHMPGGQSGHPLSPFYRTGFLQWARGEPLPFLPGPAQHTLTLQPQ